ncbi:MAG: two-component system response regulator OmpR [Burkholderiales bacterium]|jgi:two-component system phosphate regulon response regulator OmpR|nr:two-component system response regulator OmpR [Burkholderiales bacterium]
MNLSDRKKRVLVVDDDARLRELLHRYLGEQGFDVLVAADAGMLGKLLARDTVDIVILDLMLPGEDGLAICRRLRGTGETVPIIMLTAKGDEVDRILGLEMGADDYLPKPFNPRELVARIHAVLRRRPVAPHPGAPRADEPDVSFGPFTLHLATRTLSRNSDTIALTTGEFALLSALATHPRQPLSREKLMELARGRELEAFERSIDVQISRLRRLIEDDTAHPRFIQTVRGFGYVFVPDDKGAKGDTK